jgi:hypothetical protein
MLELSFHEAKVADDIMGSMMTDGTIENEHPVMVMRLYSFHAVSLPDMESASRSRVESGFR